MPQGPIAGDVTAKKNGATPGRTAASVFINGVCYWCFSV